MGMAADCPGDYHSDPERDILSDFGASSYIIADIGGAFPCKAVP